METDVRTVTKALCKSLHEQGLGNAVASTILDILPIETFFDTNSLIGFVQDIACVSQRTVARRILEWHEFNKHPSFPEAAGMVTDKAVSVEMHETHAIAMEVLEEIAQTSPLDHPPFQSVHSGSGVVDEAKEGIEESRNRVGRPRRRPLEEIREQLKPTQHRLIALVDSLGRISEVRSGSAEERHLFAATWRAGFAECVTDLRQRGLEELTLSELSFRRWCRKWNIRLFRHDRYACPHCERVHSGKVSPTDPAYLEHRFEVEGMRSLVLKVRELLADPECLIASFDYCRHHSVQAIVVDNHEKLKKDPQRYKKVTAKTSHFSATIVTDPRPEVGQCTDVHIDVIGQAKQGPAFMNVAVKYIVDYIQRNLPQRRKIHIFADSGLRSWGTLENISSISSLLDSVPIEIHYFASYHGHNSCDAHFGQIKTKIKRLGKRGMLHPDDLIQICRSIPRTYVHVIPSTTPPLLPKLHVKQIILSHYQSYRLTRINNIVKIIAYPLGPLNGDATQEYICDLNATPTVKRNTQAQISNSADADEDEEFMDFDDDDSASSEDDEDDPILEGLEWSDTFVQPIEIAPAALSEQRRPTNIADILDSMAGVKKSGDAYYFLTSFVNERGSLDRILKLWKTYCGRNLTEESRNTFIAAALEVLDVSSP